MPTRKQRKRLEKGRRHEYETVWVDSEGNELDEPPEDAAVPARERRSERQSGEKKPQQKRQQRSGRGGRPDPQPPNWRRSIRRSLILGAVMLVFFSLVNGIVSGVFFAAIYTALFVPFTYGLDRLAYNRWVKNRAGKSATKR